MNVNTAPKEKTPDSKVELVTKLSSVDMHDLCDATTLAIENGGGFGWVDVPERDIMQRFWEGVMAMPLRHLFVARLDGTICGTAQLVMHSDNNAAQSHAAQIMSVFVAPWARGHHLGKRLLHSIEHHARKERLKVLNLDVRATQKGAIGLFEDEGYVRYAEHPYYAHIKGDPVKGYFYFKEIELKK